MAISLSYITPPRLTPPGVPCVEIASILFVRREDAARFTGTGIEHRKEAGDDVQASNGAGGNNPSPWRLDDPLELAKSIYRGLSNAHVAALKADLQVRLFLSSTFTDTVLERNLLMAMVWPEVMHCSCSEGVVLRSRRV